jgi:hypothetical protein
VKKLLAALLMITLVVSPIGNFVFNDHATAEAKGYKSGKKGFNTNNNNKIDNSNIQKKKDEAPATNKSTNKTTPDKKGGFMAGGLMKGLFIGGLAGLLIGGLANMGVLGSILGFAINALAIIFLVVIIRKIFVLLKAKKEKEDMNPWKG